LAARRGLAGERHERHRGAPAVLGDHEPDAVELPALRDPVVDRVLQRLVRDGRQLDELVAHRHDYRRCCSSLAAYGAWYVMMMSLPARRIESSVSITIRSLSIQPLAAAASIIAYSPLTLYAAIGMLISSLTARITSRYASAGFTITMSAPSATSIDTSRTASATFAGSIW